ANGLRAVEQGAEVSRLQAEGADISRLQAEGLRAAEQGAEDVDVSRLQAEVQRLGSELAEWKEEAAELRTQLADMVLRSALAEAIQESDQWKERAENVEGEKASLQKQLCPNPEAPSPKPEAMNLVGAGGSDQWRERAENAEGASASLEKQLSASEATGKTLAEENVDLREKLTGVATQEQLSEAVKKAGFRDARASLGGGSATQEQLSEAVKKAGGAEAGQRAAEEEHTHFRTQLLRAQDWQTAAEEEHTHFRAQLLRAQAHVAEAQKEASDLALKLADAVPRAEVSDAKAVEAKTHRDLQEAEFELKASKGAFEDLLNKFVALQETPHSTPTR
ncbi:hypothetical protein T484DRAFT_1768131, partial [Baffinella frigidus]